ncbi:hypothetical protein CLOP_g10539 [Closterium sp. NIES-67]|nr:hypothetical protein CLOP_g10539 [Closterium sp. NIES-67]
MRTNQNSKNCLDERIYSAQHVTIRRPDTVHAEKRWRIPNVHRLPRAQPHHHQVALPNPASRQTPRPTSQHQVLLKNRLARRLPSDLRRRRGLSQNGISNPLWQLRVPGDAFWPHNAPSTFQMIMNGIFRELLDKCIIIYLDDILIYSRSREQHLKDLDAVFTLLHKNRLITKGSKCDFHNRELEFLGHIVSTE